MKFDVFVDGQEGTTGLRIHEYLARRSDINLIKIDPDKRKEAHERKRLMNESDVTFLCLPDSAARESAGLLQNPDTCLIDASTAFRTDENWAYGLPELGEKYREKIRTHNRIAVPGCHATAFLVLARPLVQHGVLPAHAALSAFSITGYSGGGKKMIADYEAGVPNLQSPRPYALQLTHKHLPEMRVHAGLQQPPIFVPVVANFYKGLAVTLNLHPQQFKRSMTPRELHALFAKHYANEKFIRVLPLGDESLDAGFFDVQVCNDTNNIDLFVFGNDERMVLMAREDNLGKGASGAAIQCMNIHLGLGEGTGL